ncbi:hypothetical protein Forpe1208_v007978 [Fusarium oxysporum f. sp. rapae]|uniref:Uncharacterized protein n=1 Tax=Fusarium oxysporum f. sp. rapae TaxID=485398 RepID=A0A8J5TVA1_FUSOX|nr:hypothetical protein Forpe1208_v007978 [Fusarium oxysporum f. sp. rapae]
MDEQDHSRSGTSSDATSWNQASTSDLNLPRDPKMERSSASNLRSAFRHTLINATSTVRAVTPDPVEPPTVSVTAESQQSQRGPPSQQSSPRTIPPGPTRRQGMVFNEVFSESYESSESSPPRQHLRHTSGSLRPRTRTMDTSMLAQRSVPPPTSERHRVGSFIRLATSRCDNGARIISTNKRQKVKKTYEATIIQTYLTSHFSTAYRRLTPITHSYR